MCNISERLLDERKRLELNQEDMALAGGVAKRTYCNYESGERVPDANFLASLVRAGADVQYILTGVRLEAASRIAGQSQTQEGSSINEPEQRQTIEVSRREKALIDNIRSCVEEDQRAIERLALRSAEAEQNSIGRQVKPPTKINKN